jgi:flagellum-specific peptidoglycan hydrolase FlgJ
MPINDVQKKWILDTAYSAAKGGHIFPKMAACEAAVESGYGTSGLARNDNNLFGMKQHKHPIYGTHNIPTQEYKDANGDGTKEWVTEMAAWVSYPDLAACFADRMATLTALQKYYPEYAQALAAHSGQDYITAVSKRWSTDPQRGAKVMGVYLQAFGAVETI